MNTDMVSELKTQLLDLRARVRNALDQNRPASDVDFMTEYTTYLGVARKLLPQARGLDKLQRLPDDNPSLSVTVFQDPLVCLRATDSAINALIAVLGGTAIPADRPSTLTAAIHDQELRERLGPLLTDPKYPDQLVREAGTVLETRIRRTAGLGSDQYGQGLVDKAMNDKTGKLRLSEMAAEHTAFYRLYQGAVGAFKNPASHRLLEELTLAQGMRIVGFIDLLLEYLRFAELVENEK